MSNTLAENRFMETTRRLTHIAGMSATLIWILTVAATWGRWRVLGAIIALQVFLLPFNLVVGFAIVKRHGMVVGEAIRAIVNVGATVAFAHGAGWPLPVWLWLPYAALVNGHENTRLAAGVVLVFCFGFDLVALLDGVPWIFPLIFTALAIYCARISRVRHGLIHDMLQRSDEQRAALAQALSTLHESQTRLANLVEYTDDLICMLDRDLTLLTFNSAFRDLTVGLRGFSPKVGASMLELVVPERRQLWRTRLDAVLRGEHVRTEQVIMMTGVKRVLEVSLNPILGADGEVAGITLFGRDVTKRKEAEQEAAAMQRQLLDISRKAGMAEIATSVLHNIGNVLNSVNVSASVVADRVRGSKGASLAKAVDLLRLHEADLPSFFADDTRARRLPEFLDKLSQALEVERRDIGDEVACLQKNIDHIKVVVSLQQSNAKGGGVVESVSMTDLLEDTIRVDASYDERHAIAITRAYEPLPAVEIDRHKLLQILVNLLSNARHAVKHGSAPERRIAVGLRQESEDWFVIEVVDTGYGIPRDNLTKIFTHGFTTRKEGHGFGLHASACAAEEMGGQLTVQSPGPGEGATFTLRLPTHPASTSIRLREISGDRRSSTPDLPGYEPSTTLRSVA